LKTLRRTVLNPAVHLLERRLTILQDNLQTKLGKMNAAFDLRFVANPAIGTN
jgi:hypothetical protein